MRSVCASYIAKTSANKSVVLSIVERTVIQLMSQSPALMSLDAHLSSLQAFIILHSIQLWDGDVRLRAQAELHANIIEDWAIQLHMRVMQAEGEWTFSHRDPTWAEWIIYESARRTVLMTLLVQGVYETSKLGICTYVPLMADLPFTTSESLWQAKGMGEWQDKVGHEGTGVTTYYGLSCHVKESGGRPLDGFGKLMLTPCLGSEYKEYLCT